jgi:hypothetical protein
MENALYYTLSTIAQTLAGSLAVLVAFVLFRLTQLDSDLDKARAVLRGKIENDDHYEAAVMGLITEGPDAMQDYVLETCQFSLKKQSGWEVFGPAHRAAKSRPVVQQRLFEALKYSLPTIGLCFVALPLIPLIKSLPSLVGWGVMAIAVLLGLISLGLYWELIKSTVVE